MNLTDLRSHLHKIEKISDEYWLTNLDDRKKKELEFHDMHRDRPKVDEMQESDPDTYEKLFGNKKFYSTVALSSNYIEEWIRINSKDKIFLDYACGDGIHAIKSAQAGAKLAIGIDISKNSVENAAVDAKTHGVSDNTYFLQADAENTKLPDQSIDVIICSGMLHHLDLSYAFPELRRILAPGGKILAAEALDYNPIIKLYRTITPQMRTDWEKAHILDMGDVKFAERFFDIGEIKFWHITSIIGPYLPKLLPLLNTLDKILTKIPVIKYLAWIFTFELISKEKKEVQTNL